jgi:hypothetical protein
VFLESLIFAWDFSPCGRIRFDFIFLNLPRSMAAVRFFLSGVISFAVLMPIFFAVLFVDLGAFTNWGSFFAPAAGPLCQIPLRHAAPVTRIHFYRLCSPASLSAARCSFFAAASSSYGAVADLLAGLGPVGCRFLLEELATARIPLPDFLFPLDGVLH